MDLKFIKKVAIGFTIFSGALWILSSILQNKILFYVAIILLIASIIAIYQIEKKQKENCKNDKKQDEESTFSTIRKNQDKERYNLLLDNDFNVANIDSNFQCSTMIMALNQIRENSCFNPTDLKFNIDEKINELNNKSKQLFLNSKYKNFVALDLETTGLSYESDRIIQVSLVKVVNGEIIDIFESYINPEMHIKNDASLINGIYDSDVKQAPKIKEIFPKILEFISNNILVMHNAKFDMSFLKEEYFRCFKEDLKSIKNICTMKLWKTLYLKYQEETPPSSKLQTLVENLLSEQEIKEYNKNKHTASCDAIATAKVFMKLFDNNATKS